MPRGPGSPTLQSITTSRVSACRGSKHGGREDLPARELAGFQGEELNGSHNLGVSLTQLGPASDA